MRDVNTAQRKRISPPEGDETFPIPPIERAWIDRYLADNRYIATCDVTG
jgi:hypothetical protein